MILPKLMRELVDKNENYILTFKNIIDNDDKFTLAKVYLLDKQVTIFYLDARRYIDDPEFDKNEFVPIAVLDTSHTDLNYLYMDELFKHYKLYFTESLEPYAHTSVAIVDIEVIRTVILNGLGSVDKEELLKVLQRKYS